MVLLLAAAPLLPACGSRFPADAAGSLDRITGASLRVGVSPHPPFTRVDEAGDVSGSEADLARAFAARLDATPDWSVGAETSLVPSLHDGELDVLIGGLDDTTPWVSEVALTRPYATVTGPDGKERSLVMAVRAGENALLTELERFLAEQAGRL